MIPKITPGYEDIMPDEYKELVEDGPYGRNLGVKDLGTFKEAIEKHPLCAGCGLGLGLRLIIASLPAPEDTIIVGTTGCNSILMPQLAIQNIHSLFGNQSAVASGLKRSLDIRFPDKVKDVVVIGGDGGVADIGIAFTLHAWIRMEKITTIMLDNECYANTGGQESSMTKEGTVLNMAPVGKKYPKAPMFELARESGCVYVAEVSPLHPRKLEKYIKRAIIIARTLGPTYVQVFTPCPTNYKFSPSETLAKTKEGENIREYITPEAEKLIKEQKL